MPSFAWFVARRYLTAQRRQAFIGLISAFSILGVGVGVAAVIIALALMTGVQGEMRDRIVGSTAHMFVHKLSAFDDWPSERARMLQSGVVGAAPAVFGPALVQPGGGESQFVMLKGIDPEAEAGVVDLAQAMVSGSLSALRAPGADEHDGLILGKDLAVSLGAQVGDVVDVYTAALTATPMGFRPRVRPLRLVGIADFGFHEVDKQFGFVHLQTALGLLKKEQWDLIQLKLADLNAAPVVRASLERALGPEYSVQDWTEMNASLYSALWLEKVAISLAVGLIVMVAALNIVASLVLLVMEKTHDIAILRTIGTPAATIRRVFMLQGLTIGVIGTALGVVLGVGVSWAADTYRLIQMPADVYQISHLPFRVVPLDVAVVVTAAVAICFGATIYPSWRAGRIDPAEALRHS